MSLSGVPRHRPVGIGRGTEGTHVNTKAGTKDGPRTFAGVAATHVLNE